MISRNNKNEIVSTEKFGQNETFNYKALSDSTRRVGDLSLHFYKPFYKFDGKKDPKVVLESGSFISFKHSGEEYDDGTQLPEKMKFKNGTYDSESKTFTGTLDFGDKKYK